MRFIITFFFFAISMMTMDAQTVSFGPLHSADSPREDWLLPGDTITQVGKKMIYQGKPMKNMKYSISSPSFTNGEAILSNSTKPTSSYTDTISNTKAQDFYQNPINDLTYSLAPTYGYGLHKGLNVSIGASAFATFGKGLPHKGGFSQNINATYLAPLTKDGKLWIAGGGYFNNTFWGSDSYRDVGLYALMGYKFNEHWEAYVYGQLSISNNYSSLYNRYARYSPYGYGRYGMGYYPGLWGMGSTMPFGYGMGMPGANVLGAGVKYNVNKNFSIGFNIEGVWYDNKSLDYFDRYNYPTPSHP